MDVRCIVCPASLALVNDWYILYPFVALFVLQVGATFKFHVGICMCEDSQQPAVMVTVGNNR